MFVRRRAGVRGRFAFTVIALLLALAASWSSGGALTAPVFAAALGSALAFAVSPAAGDEVCGERGVRSGWDARAFGEFEEWRLAGDHLRWKLRGEWLACSVPRALHGELRSRLEAACPGRESAFKG